MSYDEIDLQDSVSVRSEVARLTKLYDRAVRNNTMNNPDMYMSGGGADAITGLRARPLPGQPQLPAILPAPAAEAGAPAVPSAMVAVPEIEESPATAKPKSRDEPAKDTPKPPEDAGAKGVGKESANGSKTREKDEPASSGSTAGSQAKIGDPKQAEFEASKNEAATAMPLASEIDEGPVTAALKPNVKSEQSKKDG